MQVVFASAHGAVITDPEGKKYLDFLAAYSAVNQGHRHPRLLKAMTEQLEYCTLSSRAFYNNRFGEYAHFVTKFFGYDRVLPMNTGAEAVETALKMVRKWGHQVKNKDDQAIQGEAGVYVPRLGYYKAVRDLCTKYNVLWIADEIQSGLGRAGKLLAVDYEDARPDVVTLGKALSGGMYPVSAVLADQSVMGVFTPGTHGSTFGGNPLASVLGIESLKVLVQEKMIENSFNMGEKFRTELTAIQSRHPKIITAVRGRGLMNAIDLDESKDDHAAYLLCKSMLKNGLLAKPTHGKTVRLTPPLCLTEKQVGEAAGIIEKSIAEVEAHLKY